MKRYFLNPDYKLRKDGDRFLLYCRNDKKYDSEEVETFIHPYHAWILSLFSKGISLEDVICLLVKKNGISASKASEIIYPWINNSTSFILNIKGVELLIPKNIIIEENTIIDFDNLTNYDIALPESVEWVDLETRRLEVPLNITFMLTNRCVTNCYYCYADTKTQVKNLLPTKRIKEIIHQAKNLGVNNINLIGGEVFLHPYWYDILKELIDAGFCPDSISTKVPLTKGIIKHLKEIGYKGKIQLSIDSINPQLTQLIYKVNTHYIECVKKGIMLLEEANIPYKIETVLTKDTALTENLTSLYSFFEDKKNLLFWEIREAMFSHFIRECDFQALMAPKEVLKNINTYIKSNIEKKAPFPVITRRSESSRKYFQTKNGCKYFIGRHCTALNSHFFVLPDGKCTICEQLYWNANFIIGDLNNDNIMDVWNSQRSKELLTIKQENINVKSACHDCKLFNDCFIITRNRCWSDIIKAYGASNWDFPDPRCCYAPKMNTNITYDI